MKQKIIYKNEQIDLEIDLNEGLALINGEHFEYEISEYNGRYYFRVGNQLWILTNVQVKGAQI